MERFYEEQKQMKEKMERFYKEQKQMKEKQDKIIEQISKLANIQGKELDIQGKEFETTFLGNTDSIKKQFEDIMNDALAKFKINKGQLLAVYSIKLNELINAYIRDEKKLDSKFIKKIDEQFVKSVRLLLFQVLFSSDIDNILKPEEVVSFIINHYLTEYVNIYLPQDEKKRVFPYKSNV